VSPVAWIVLGVLALVGVLLVAWVIGLYNGLIRRRNQVDNAWGQIGVQLERRYDLVPNLVQTVEGYPAHERSTLDAVLTARAAAIGAQGPFEQAAADNALTGALKSLFAVTEADPDLKANTSFRQLQDELTRTEDRAAYARQYYKNAVLSYNNSVHTVPSALIAGPFGFRIRGCFRAVGEEQGPVRVQF
jgi:LemA protein